MRWMASCAAEVGVTKSVEKSQNSQSRTTQYARDARGALSHKSSGQSSLNKQSTIAHRTTTTRSSASSANGLQVNQKSVKVGDEISVDNGRVKVGDSINVDENGVRVGNIWVGR